MPSRDDPRRPSELVIFRREHTVAPPPAVYSLLATFFGALALLTRARSWAWLTLLFCLAAFPRIDWSRSDPRQYTTLFGFTFMVMYTFDLLNTKLIVSRLNALVGLL